MEDGPRLAGGRGRTWVLGVWFRSGREARRVSCVRARPRRRQSLPIRVASWRTRSTPEITKTLPSCCLHPPQVSTPKYGRTNRGTEGGRWSSSPTPLRSAWQRRPQWSLRLRAAADRSSACCPALDGCCPFCRTNATNVQKDAPLPTERQERKTDYSTTCKKLTGPLLPTGVRASTTIFAVFFTRLRRCNACTDFRTSSSTDFEAEAR